MGMLNEPMVGILEFHDPDTYLVTDENAYYLGIIDWSEDEDSFYGSVVLVEPLENGSFGITILDDNTENDDSGCSNSHQGYEILREDETVVGTYIGDEDVVEDGEQRTIAFIETDDGFFIGVNFIAKDYMEIGKRYRIVIQADGDSARINIIPEPLNISSFAQDVNWSID